MLLWTAHSAAVAVAAAAPALSPAPPGGEQGARRLSGRPGRRRSARERPGQRTRAHQNLPASCRRSRAGPCRYFQPRLRAGSVFLGAPGLGGGAAAARPHGWRGRQRAQLRAHRALPRRLAALPSRPSSALLAVLALRSQPPRFWGRLLNRTHPGRSKWRTPEFKEGGEGGRISASRLLPTHGKRPRAVRRPVSKPWGSCPARPVLVRVLGRGPAVGWLGAPVPHLLEPASTRSDPSRPAVHAARACTEGPQLASGKQNEIVGSQLRMSAPSWISRLGPHFGQSRPAGGDADGSGPAPWPWLC